MTRLEEIYRLYYKSLVAFLMKTGTSEQDAEDIATDAIINCYEYDGDVSSLLFVSAKNLLIDKQRADKRHAASHKEVLYLSGDHEEQTQVVESIVLAKMYAAIKMLPKKCRLVLELSMQGINLRDIAASAGVSHRTVINQYARAIKLIKNTLQGVKNHNVGRRIKLSAPQYALNRKYRDNRKNKKAGN